MYYRLEVTARTYPGKVYARHIDLSEAEHERETIDWHAVLKSLIENAMTTEGVSSNKTLWSTSTSQMDGYLPTMYGIPLNIHAPEAMFPL